MPASNHRKSSPKHRQTVLVSYTRYAAGHPETRLELIRTTTSYRITEENVRALLPGRVLNVRFVSPLARAWRTRGAGSGAPMSVVDVGAAWQHFLEHIEPADEDETADDDDDF